MTGTLRIVRVLPFWAEAFGGPVAQARLVHRELLARGHDVRLVTADAGMPASVPRDTWHELDGVPTFVARAGVLAQSPPYVPPRSAKAALRSALGDCDVAALHVGLSAWGPMLARSAGRAGVPFVYNAEGALDPVRLAVKRWQKRAFVALYERRVLRQAAAVHVVTDAEREDVHRLGAPSDRIHVIPNGVVLPPPPDAAARTRGRARLGVPQHARLLLFLGRLHPLKGIDLALAAAAPVLRERADLHFVIVGPDDGAGAAVRAGIATLGCGERVRVLPAMHGDAKAEALAAADVFVLTSRSEGLPNAVLEAAAAGVPAWISTACRLPEVAEYGAGAVAEPEPAALRAALAAVLAAVDAGDAMRKNARTMVAERFTLAAVVDRLEALYAGLVRR